MGLFTGIYGDLWGFLKVLKRRALHRQKLWSFKHKSIKILDIVQVF